MTSMQITDTGYRLEVSVPKDEAITKEHALSLAAHELTAQGHGDTELTGISETLYSYNLTYQRNGDWS